MQIPHRLTRISSVLICEVNISVHDIGLGHCPTGLQHTLKVDFTLSKKHFLSVSHCDCNSYDTSQLERMDQFLMLLWKKRNMAKSLVPRKIKVTLLWTESMSTHWDSNCIGIEFEGALHTTSCATDVVSSTLQENCSCWLSHSYVCAKIRVGYMGKGGHCPTQFHGFPQPDVIKKRKKNVMSIKFFSFVLFFLYIFLTNSI